MNKLLVIVDMQKDFIDGSLANKDAKAIVPDLCKFIKEWDGDITCTLDTHHDDYLDTQEGKNLPIKHCIKLTEGWLIDKDIREALAGRDVNIIEKETFGSWDLADRINWKGYDEVVFVGTCTDICVISNVLTVKAINRETPLVVYADLCAGLTPEKHEAALEVMKSCQVDVRYYTEGK